MILFFLFLVFLVIQRLFELRIASRNEKTLKEKGAVEAGKDHYFWMVALHVSFFMALIIEVIVFQSTSPFWWWIPLIIFAITQLLRVWAMRSLGVFWNTKIILLPGAKVVAKGPYKYIRHPNYTVVTIEILVIPLIFGAYVTAVLFTLLNIWMLSVRIKEEEKALAELTNYQQCHGEKSRFVPLR